MESRLESGLHSSEVLRFGSEDLQPFLQRTIPTGRDSFIASMNASEAMEDNGKLLAIRGLWSPDVVEPLNRSIVES